MTIEDMKERILNSGRTPLNASSIQKPQGPPPPSPPPTDGPRGQTHRPMESGAMAYHPPSGVGHQDATAVPSQSTFLRGPTPLRIPKPSELFGIQPGFHRPSPSPHATLQSIPPPSVLSTIPQLPPPGQLAAASATRQREHDRRIRAMATKFQRANLKRRLAASQGPVDPSLLSTTTTGPLGPDLWMSMHPTSVDVAHAPSLWGGMFSGLRQWASSRLQTSDGQEPIGTPERDAGVHVEFDTDIVDALVYTVGRWLGLDTEQLRDSPGLRTLVSRNIQWFRSSPDWMKLVGLVLAKKLNHSLDCPKRSAGDLQRMVLDRMVHDQNAEHAVDSTGQKTESVPPSGVSQVPEAVAAVGTEEDAMVVDSPSAVAAVALPQQRKKQKQLMPKKPTKSSQRNGSKAKQLRIKIPKTSRTPTSAKTRRSSKRSPTSVVSLDTLPMETEHTAVSTELTPIPDNYPSVSAPIHPIAPTTGPVPSPHPPDGDWESE